MKLINSTFSLNGQKVTIAAAFDSVQEAGENVKAFCNVFGKGLGTPKDIEHNVVVFGVDGPGESLNKLHKPKARKKSTPKEKGK